MLDTIIKWFSAFGGVIALFLAILKIVEYIKNKPILTFTSQYNGGFEYIDGKTILKATLDIANVGTKSTKIKKIVYDIYDNRKKKLNKLSNTSQLEKNLVPGDCITENFSWIVNDELPKVKYYFRLIIDTTYCKKEHFIPLEYFNSDDIDKAWAEDINSGFYDIK